MTVSSSRANEGLCYWAAAAVLLVTACGGKERPPSLKDETFLQDATVVIHPRPDGSVDAAGDDAASLDAANLDAAPLDGHVVGPIEAGIVDAGRPDPLVGALHKACPEMPPFDAMLCYATEKGHPADTAVYRNMDVRNGVMFQFAIDAAHRQFDSIASFQGHIWKLRVIAPLGQELKVGSYSSGSNDGASLTFAWDEGQCDGAQSATFDIFAISWDDKNIPTHAAIDFKHHCGDLNAPALLAEYRLFSSRP